MRVLKNLAGVRVIPRAVVDARAEAEALVARARAEAEGVRARARAEGLELGRADAAALMARAATHEALRAEQHGAEVASLALEVARAVLGREAQAGPEVLRDVTARALARVRRARQVVLRVHPEDAAWARESCRAWLPAGLDPELLAVEPDPLVERGGVVVETEIGRVDARLEVQIEAIGRALRG